MIFKSLIDAIFPPTCPFCDGLHRATLIEPVCGDCFGATQWLGGAVSSAVVADSSLDGVVATCRFDGPVVDAIHRLKYNRRHDLGPMLGKLLVEPAFLCGPHDVVIPVPLHPVRLRARGFNQAQLVARPIAKAMRAPLLFDAVRRTRETPAQVGLSAAERLENVRGAFAALPAGADSIRGKRCLLVDDVMTTGATIAACARALHRAGASNVRAIVIAVA